MSPEAVPLFGGVAKCLEWSGDREVGGARGGGAVNLREARLAPAADEADERREGEEEKERDGGEVAAAEPVHLADNKL